MLLYSPQFHRLVTGGPLPDPNVNFAFAASLLFRSTYLTRKARANGEDSTERMLQEIDVPSLRGSLFLLYLFIRYFFCICLFYLSVSFFFSFPSFLSFFFISFCFQRQLLIAREPLRIHLCACAFWTPFPPGSTRTSNPTISTSTPATPPTAKFPTRKSSTTRLQRQEGSKIKERERDRRKWQEGGG